jgi:hypothetical protein
MTADTLFSKVIYARDLIPYKKDTIIPDSEIAEKEEAPQINSKDAINPTALDGKNQTPPLPSAAGNTEAELKNDVPKKELEIKSPLDKIPPPETKKPKKPVLAKNKIQDTIKVSPVTKDSLSTDTVRTRIVSAFHNAKIFKSDLQAKADSMFFSDADSTVRCYVSPIIWAQGSQLTGDTVYLQLKNKKLDNMLLHHNSFIVNTEDADSTNFNQIKGKVITGYFQDNKLNNMFVDGNAESIYYLKDDTVYSGLNHMISSRLRIMLKDNKLSNISAIRAIDASITPMNDLQEEDRVLKGFIWKPRDRPKSKEEIIPQLAEEKAKPAKNKSEKKTVPAKSAPVKTIPGKTALPKTEPVKPKDPANPILESGVKAELKKAVN